MGIRRDYAGPFVYVNNDLAWVSTPHGRIVKSPGNGLKKELHLRDHLGNTRLVLEKTDANYKIVQEAAYYPFGMAISDLSFALPNENNSTQNRYLYNGKELQDDFGLDWYDYGARFYDAQIARWHSVDPLAEQGRRWSPYVYAFNNPILFIDPDGRWPDNPLQNILQYAVNRVVDHVVTKTQDLIVDLASYTMSEASKIADNIEATPYIDGEVKVSAGATQAAKIHGVGYDANIASAEIAAVRGDISNQGATGGLNVIGRDSQATIEHSLSVGYKGADVAVSHSYTTQTGEGVVENQTTTQATYGVPLLGFGASYQNQRNLITESSSHTLRTGVFTSGAIGFGWRLSFSGSAGLRISINNREEDE